MNLEIKRTSFFPTCTIGELYVDGVKECYTLEDTVREVPSKPVEEWKIPKETAIPYGKYRVTVDFSNRFHRSLPLLLGVRGFVGIRIHPGNTSVDTEGCILVGQIWSEKNPTFIGASRAAFAGLFEKIQGAIQSGQEVWVTIDKPKEGVV